jgi:hypothetical protein
MDLINATVYFIQQNYPLILLLILLKEINKIEIAKLFPLLFNKKIKAKLNWSRTFPAKNKINDFFK